MGGVAVSRKRTVDEMLDEFRGQGGSYVVDPVTGDRKLVERTKESSEELLVNQEKEQDNGTTTA